MTTWILEPPSDSHGRIRTAAFRLLLDRSGPVAAQEIAAATGIESARVLAQLVELATAGRIRRDNDSGRVVGSAGLSVTPDRHQIELDGRRFWTWCAYDIFGIFGALAASGSALSPSPIGGEPIVVRFERGRPIKNEAVLFRPDEELMECCDNIYEQWCPNSNLFASRTLATNWATQHAVQGKVMDVAEAADIATADWSNVV